MLNQSFFKQLIRSYPCFQQSTFVCQSIATADNLSKSPDQRNKERQESAQEMLPDTIFNDDSLYIFSHAQKTDSCQLFARSFTLEIIVSNHSR